MTKFIHVMIRVLHEGASTAFYCNGLGFEHYQTRDFTDFKLVYLRDPASGVELELTVNKSRTESYQMGEGYGHIALVCDDLPALHRHLSELGYAPRDIKTFAPDGELVATFFFVTDPDGYEVEVIERSERYQ